MSQRIKDIAREISFLLPSFLRNMYPYVFKQIGISPSQILALSFIQEKEVCCLNDLRRHMHVSAPTITGIVDRLEKAGYIRRLQDKKDRRVTNIILTRRGRAVVCRYRKNIMLRWEYVLSKLDKKDRLDIIRILKHITQGFNDGTI